MISREDIRKLASLSRLSLSEEEEERFATEIDSILEYVGQVQTLVSQASSEVPKLRNVMREDGEPHESGVYTEAISNSFPQREENYLKVKKILP